MRGDAPYLGIVASGRLDVYAIALDRKTPAQARIPIAGSTEAIKDLFPNLANHRPWAARTQRGWISTAVLNLLTEPIDSRISIELAHCTDLDRMSVVLGKRGAGRDGPGRPGV